MPFEDFKLTAAYHVAAHVRDQIFNLDPDHSLIAINDFFVESESFKEQCLSQQRWTFLHDVIQASFEAGIDYVERKVGCDAEGDFLQILDDHGIEYCEKQVWIDEGNDCEAYYNYLTEEIYEQVTPLVVNEVFTLLFADRSLLLQLGTVVAETVKPLKVADHPDLLAMDGKVIRCTYWPSWVKKALMYRDKGRCSICLCDITGCFAVGEGYHMDHIVPLNLGGTNDITNLQILCETCNLAKGGDEIKTSTKYMLYW